MWLTKLGYKPEEKVVIFHGDDAGLHPAINDAIQELIDNGKLQSCSIVPNADFANSFILNSKGYDIGLHLSFVGSKDVGSWKPISKNYICDLFPLDHSQEYLDSISSEVFSDEVFSQWNYLIDNGIKPTHIDTHSATAFMKPEFAMSYIGLGLEKQTFPMVVWPKKDIGGRFSSTGFDYDQLSGLLEYYPYPILDDLYTIPVADTYEEKIVKFKNILDSIQPGLNQVICHPSLSDVFLDRFWDYSLFSDLSDYIASKEFTFTTWQELTNRYNQFHDSPP